MGIHLIRQQPAGLIHKRVKEGMFLLYDIRYITLPRLHIEAVNIIIAACGDNTFKLGLPTGYLLIRRQ
ncbi:hypothetical protein [Kingella potus]|uniref:hypothetical protein n=1 Tax=Kingella potus TaxID=265175 RepID=UPI001FD211FE|nr:hypothetical protein [Kingella potus]UOP01489.1 hypothetical protein LVJ84_04675 [Kingella potus]